MSTSEVKNVNVTGQINTMRQSTIKMTESSTSWKLRMFMNKFMVVVCGLALLLILLPLGSIFVEIIVNGVKNISVTALTGTGKGPLSTQNGIYHAIYGTLIVSLLATIMGVPLGIITGLYLEYYGKGIFADALRIGIDTMVAIPTIITGVVVWALIVVGGIGFSILSGSVALAFIMIPIIAKTTEEMIRLVPDTYIEVGYSLGLTKSKTATNIVLPLAARGIASGVILAFARIIGETAPLLFTAFFSQSQAHSFLDPSATLPVLIYKYAISPWQIWQNMAWVAAFVLLMFNMTVVLLTRKYLAKTTR